MPALRRLHELDALRAFAMLLGIVLHGLIAYIPIPLWPVQDVRQDPVYMHGLHAIHGFRMPLFFLISGFFTAMLWRERGLEALIRHRARRVLLPLVVFGVVLIPSILAISWLGVSVQVDRGTDRKEEMNPLPEPDKIEEAWQDIEKDLPAWARLLALALFIFFIAAIIPVFHHLWFLYYLLWLVGGFAVVAWLARRRGWRPWSDRAVLSPLRWAWLIPLTFLFQVMMFMAFGADTMLGIVPWPPVLGYYAVFFGYGALCYGREGFLERVGTRWGWCLVLALPVLVLGIHTLDARNALVARGFSEHGAGILANHLATSLCATVYAWLMSFGLMGFFRRWFPAENPRIRYLSDASYWLYLMHLPLILLLQIGSGTWEIPSLVKFIGTCSVATGLLLAVYAVAVRRTWIGTMLNGKR